MVWGVCVSLLSVIWSYIVWNLIVNVDFGMLVNEEFILIVNVIMFY